MKWAGNLAGPRYFQSSWLKKRMCTLPGCSNNCLRCTGLYIRKEYFFLLKKADELEGMFLFENKIPIKSSQTTSTGESSHRKSDIRAENMLKCPVSCRLLITQLTPLCSQGLWIRHPGYHSSDSNLSWLVPLTGCLLPVPKTARAKLPWGIQQRQGTCDSSVCTLQDGQQHPGRHKRGGQW